MSHRIETLADWLAWADTARGLPKTKALALAQSILGVSSRAVWSWDMGERTIPAQAVRLLHVYTVCPAACYWVEEK